HDAIAAALTDLDGAGRGAPVAVVGVAVVACFIATTHAVAAAGLGAAIGRAAVTADGVPIVAVFTELHDAVTTYALARAQLELDDATRCRRGVVLRGVGRTGPHTALLIELEVAHEIDQRREGKDRELLGARTEANQTVGVRPGDPDIAGRAIHLDVVRQI